MSRVADALQKKRKEAGGVPDTSNELVLRTMADVPDEWQLQGPAPVEQPAVTKLVPPAPAAPPELRIAPPPTPIASRRRETSTAPPPDDEVVALARRVFLGDDGQAARGRRALFAAVGSTTRSGSIAIGLALTLARETSRAVSLVDLNLEGATLHDALQLEASPGLSDAVLQGMLPDACTQEILSAPSLRFLASGSDAQGLRASLHESRSRNRIRALLGTFDYVVAHAAALSTADLVALGGLFDGVVLVLEAGKGSPDDLRATAAALKEANVKVLGTVVDSR
jgi:Mrp family chromosome partitioning ATPase